MVLQVILRKHQAMISDIFTSDRRSPCFDCLSSGFFITASKQHRQAVCCRIVADRDHLLQFFTDIGFFYRASLDLIIDSTHDKEFYQTGRNHRLVFLDVLRTMDACSICQILDPNIPLACQAAQFCLNAFSSFASGPAGAFRSEK